MGVEADMSHEFAVIGKSALCVTVELDGKQHALWTMSAYQRDADGRVRGPFPFFTYPTHVADLLAGVPEPERESILISLTLALHAEASGALPPAIPVVWCVEDLREDGHHQEA